MPPGAPYNSFLHPYFPIRVDEFTDLTNFEPNYAPKDSSFVHFLTHTHTDHIGGLQAKSFAQTVYCSEDAKQMLLRHEVYSERRLYETDMRTEKRRTFKHLKVDPLVGTNGKMYFQGSRDLLKSLPLNIPTEVSVSANEAVTVTLIDANHCPGAVMFLIEDAKHAVLHTGDFRAEPWFLESLRHNPFLQPYLALHSTTSEGICVARTLDAIFLDTACVMQTVEVPTKEMATSGLISLLKLFPTGVCFFINSWTWGYEDILKAISRAFGCQIHVDRYKHSIFTHLNSDPFLRSIGTLDACSTRFHACERFDRCEMVDVGDYDHLEARGYDWSLKKQRSANSKAGKRVVYVNPVSSMNASQWETYQEETRKEILDGADEVNCILVPLNRHSPLPELQSFVSLFQPKEIVPNTLSPRFDQLDWTAINRVFAPCLSSSSLPVSEIPKSLLPLGPPTDNLHQRFHRVVASGGSESEVDAALKNLVGDEADAIAAHWCSPDLDGNLPRKVQLLQLWLGTGLHLARGSRQALKITMPSSPLKPDDEDSSSEVDDDRGKTAHKLFGGDDMDWERSSVSFDLSSDPHSQDGVENMEAQSNSNGLDGITTHASIRRSRAPSTPSQTPAPSNAFPAVMHTPTPKFRSMRDDPLFGRNVTGKGTKRESPDSSTRLHIRHSLSTTPANSTQRPLKRPRVSRPSPPSHAEVLKIDFKSPFRTANKVLKSRDSSRVCSRPMALSDSLLSAKPRLILKTTSTALWSKPRTTPVSPSKSLQVVPSPREEPFRGTPLSNRPDMRLSIVHALSQASPDLVDQSFGRRHSTFQKQLEQSSQAELDSTPTKANRRALGIRNESIADMIKVDLRTGRRLALPPLLCAQGLT